MRLQADSKLCQIGRVYDAHHPTCRSCVIGCALHASLPNLPSKPTLVKTKGKVPARKMTIAEEEAGNMLRMEFAGCKVVFHGLAFYLDAGHRYTADWCVHLPGGKILVVEVKQEGRNGFVQQSQRDAKVRFDQTKLEWPMMRFRWMTKTSDGWQIREG